MKLFGISESGKTNTRILSSNERQ